MEKRVIKELKRLLKDEGVIDAPHYLTSYSYDASLDRAQPELVVFPKTTEELVAIAKIASREGIPLVPRGAGTSLSGGPIPVKGGIVVNFTRMNKILSIDLENRRAVVQPGVVNMELQRALSDAEYIYGPDPSSQIVCTLGGNVAENSGGPHCLKYGFTINHVLGLKIVTADGEVVDLGGPCLDMPGYDLVALLVGSEGMLGMVAEITLNIMPKAEAVETLLAVFKDQKDGAGAVSDVVASGIIPTAMELMDKVMVGAIQASMDAGYPPDAEAVLLIELDGLRDGMERYLKRLEEICLRRGALQVRIARDEREREQLWKGRKGAASAVGRIAPNALTQDGGVPPSKIAEVLEEIEAIAKRHRLLIGNVAHAGDGNLHPIMLFDERNPDEMERVKRAGEEILRACVRAGGTISGEHGIGLEKRDYMGLLFSPQELKVMYDIKGAFDPNDIMNPGKVLPQRVGGY